jgi:hypothetical protein
LLRYGRICNVLNMELLQFYYRTKPEPDH